MKKYVLFTLAVSLMTVFTSCSDDDNLTPEEQEEKNKQELLATIGDNFNVLVSKKWAFTEFEPSDDMVAASKTEDGYDALTAINYAEGAKPFEAVISFTESDDVITPSVEFNYDKAKHSEMMLAFDMIMIGEDLGFGQIFGDAVIFATISRTVASAFAADNLKVDEIASDETGKLVFTFEQNDLSEQSYEDVVLRQRVLVKGNVDKIYIEGDKLTVETTSEKYGVSKYIYTEVE